MPDRQLLKAGQGAAQGPNSHKAPCRPQPRQNQLGAGDVLVFPFHPLDPSPFCCPWPQARGPRERQGQLLGPGVLGCGLYLAATGHQAALFVWAEPEGSRHLLAVPVRSLFCLPVSDAVGLSPAQASLQPSASRLPPLGSLPLPPPQPRFTSCP